MDFCIAEYVVEYCFKRLVHPKTKALSTGSSTFILEYIKELLHFRPLFQLDIDLGLMDK